MRGEIDGVPFNRCDLCGNDIPKGEKYCRIDKNNCLKDASKYLDALVMEYDTELAYECMTKILEGRK